MTRPVGAVDQQDVLPSVRVIVDERAPRSKRFRQELAAVRTVVVAKCQPAAGGDVNELESRCGVRLANDVGSQRREAKAGTTARQKVTAIHCSGLIKPCWSA